MDYSLDTSIDKFNLDKEWELLPSKYINWAEVAAQAQYDKDVLDSTLKLIEAELDKDIRLNPEMYGVTSKLTEKVIASIIVMNDRYKEALYAYLNALKNAKILNAVEKSFEFKKKALDRLTDFYFSGYYAKSSSIASNYVSDENTKQHLNTLHNNPRINRRRDIDNINE